MIAGSKKKKKTRNEVIIGSGNSDKAEESNS
jgi:hypothetical protein